jgi:hypothetical protein
MPALEALRLAVRAALDACRVNALPQVGEETVGLKTTARNRIKMQRLLVNFNLFFETNLRNWNEGLGCGANFLNFDANLSVPG